MTKDEEIELLKKCIKELGEGLFLTECDWDGKLEHIIYFKTKTKLVSKEVYNKVKEVLE